MKLARSAVAFWLATERLGLTFCAAVNREIDVGQSNRGAGERGGLRSNVGELPSAELWFECARERVTHMTESITILYNDKITVYEC